MKRELRKNSVMVVLLVIVCIIAFILSGNRKFEGPHIEYQCDVKISLSTKINIDKENEEFVKVSGNILKFITDPLTMYDLQEQEIAYAGDEYHLIAQDSHTIFVNGQCTAEMVGLVDLFGESYDIYNPSGEKVAELSINFLNTSGAMYNTEGKVIADFRSKLFFNDFKVRISEECELDDKTVLMIFCSYYSDKAADNNSSTSSSSRKSGS